MNIIEAITRRKSIRSFKPDPVPREVLARMLEAAIRAPSARNTQSWEITVVTGEVLDSIRQGNIEALYLGGIINPDISVKPHEGRYRERQNELAASLFGLMGIARGDEEKRAEWRAGGFRFFDAPAAIILAVDKSVEKSHSQFELGCLAQNICLAALEFGLGTCIEDAGITYPDVIRKFTGIVESKRIVMGIAIGYPDWDFPANKLVTGREPLANVVTWRGF